MASVSMTMKDWAQARIATQQMIGKGASLWEHVPATLADKVSERWTLNASGQKELGKFNLRCELTGRALIVFFPGTQTPTCSRHLPLLVSSADKLKQIGVTIFVIAVNRTDDLFAWAQQHDTNHKLTFIPDMEGEFTLAAGFGEWSNRLGLMSSRVAVVKDETDKILAVLPELDTEKKQCNGQCEMTGTNIADTVINTFKEYSPKKQKL